MSTSTWRHMLCTLAVLVIGLGLVNAAAPAVADDEGAAPETDASASPHSLVSPNPIASDQGAPAPNAPDAVCVSTVLPNNGGTSGNGRAPLANFRGIKSVYLITPAEMTAAGFPSGGSPSAIGWHYSTAPGVAATGTLIVYLQNTSDTVYSKGTSFSAAIVGMTTIHNSAATTLPNTTTPFDITLSGGSPFTYTGGGLYVAFEWRYAVGTLGTGVVSCNTALASPAIETAQTTGVPPAGDAMSASAFRPETRLTATINNDVSVDYVISYGSLAEPLVGPQTVQAVVTNHGNASTNVPVTLNITGAETFTNIQTVASLAACGGQTTVSFAPFTPSAIGSDTVTVSVPNDDANGNNSKNRPLDETYNLYSYKHPGTTATGGVGLTGATGDFVAKFKTTGAAKVQDVKLEFPLAPQAGQIYRVAIYPESAPGSGTPGLAPIYEDAADRTVVASGPVTITLPSPVPVGPGTFFVGVEQTGTVNAGVGFDTEVPIRSGSFFFTTPHPPASWTDFSPGNNFKLNIGIDLVQCSVAADCNDNNACTDDACTSQLCTHVNNNSTSCDGNPCSDPDQCVNGTCVPGPNPCNDNNACTTDLCGQGGGCSYVPVDCNDNNPCTDDFCIPATGCGHSNNTAACTDNNPCTIGDACSGGVCVPGSGALPAVVQFCSSAAITINDSASPPTLATPYPATITVSGLNSYLCSATVNLNGFSHTFPSDTDVLLDHQPGPTAIIMSDCGDGTPVSNVNLTLSDAAATPIPATIVSGTYKPTNLTDTFGGDAWPAPAPAAGPGSALSTFTGRNPNGPWNLFVVDDFNGDSGSFAGGWCVNIVAVCTADADCNDNNVCTTDACVNNSCTHTNNTNTCDDNNACTANDTCANGVCVGGPPPPCDDNNACTANQCNPTTGLCENPPIVCNDNNSCTDDTCNPSTGCVYTPNDNNTCSDNSLCTSPDVCQNGVCVGQNPVVCAPDANPCTTEACNPATGLCESNNNTNACDDGDACTLGDVCGTAFAENWDGETAPNLPATWTSTVNGADETLWTTVNTTSDTAPNSAFGVDGIGPTAGDELLISPVFNVMSATAKVTFRNRWSFENSGGTTFYDGGVLEISINGGPFTDIITAGGSFSSGGYNTGTGSISSGFSNPLAGRSAWAAVSAGYPSYLTTVVNLPAAAAGQPVQLQWRIGTDTSVGAPGQNIDSIVLTDVNTCLPGAGTPNCADTNPCTDDYCDPSLGCQHANNTASCDDANACTVLDTCSNGSCAGTVITCNDSNPCTDDSCSPGTGCVFAPNTVPCDDGNACTAGDTCGGGSCQPGTPVGPSAETTNLRVQSDKQTYIWDPQPNSPRYDVVRGLIGALPVGPGGGDEVCFDDLAAAVITDGTLPAVGAGFWYLSRGENNCAAPGTFGTQGVHGAPGAPRVTTTCP